MNHPGKNTGNIWVCSETIHWCFSLFFQGACILNMLRDFLTPEAFKIGIVRYLRQYSYQNTVNAHLWESLTNVSHMAPTLITYLMLACALGSSCCECVCVDIVVVCVYFCSSSAPQMKLMMKDSQVVNSVLGREVSLEPQWVSFLCISMIF